jgi:ubiquinone/menaquinone biosynthesis C-methylase UbiE
VKPHVCSWRHAYLFDNVLRRLFHRPEEMFAGYVEPGMTALDVGCGMGYFSIGMARMLGNTGRVVAVDLQQEMLDTVRRRADRAGVGERIHTHRCAADALNIKEQADFALAFWMVHEVADSDHLLGEIRANLKPGGRFLIAEPRFHVKERDFHETLARAGRAGFSVCDAPRIRLSRATLLRVV